MFANIGDIGGSQPLGWVWRENAYTWQQNQPTPPSISVRLSLPERLNGDTTSMSAINAVVDIDVYFKIVLQG